ncbi:hypothetical protein GUJ93_ZPchr0011g27136 [Zizania palustris]|uniref:Receptor kinase-like protein Xa21 n=1 Tax=Zizania palustris TaxID=103762 RepID=A0A8J6BKZ3_ZIZPA|nr:hypothetical protein GUJ93_ZPchr0011g27136 [Zizania palustris]
MEKRKEIRELRDRMDKTLALPDLADEDLLRSLVKKQILASSLSGSIEGDIDLIAEARSKEISNFLGMLNTSVNERSSKIHEVPHKEWKVKQDTDQLRVMYREGPEGTPFHTLLAEGFADGPIDVCTCVSWESSLYKKWFPQYNLPTFKVAQSGCLKKVRIGEEISFVRVKVPWPVSEREALLHYFELEYLKEDLVIVIMKTISDMDNINIQTHGFSRDGIPEAGDTVRIDVVGGFVLQRITKDISFFRAIANMDIKLDFVPPWLINFISRQLIGSGHKLYQKAVSTVASCDEDYKKALRGPLYVRIREYQGSTDTAKVRTPTDENATEALPDNPTLQNPLADTSVTSSSEIVEEESEQKVSLKLDHLAAGPSNQPADQEKHAENKAYISPEVEQALSILDTAISIIRGNRDGNVRAVQKFLSYDATLDDSTMDSRNQHTNILNADNLPNGHPATLPPRVSRDAWQDSSFPKENVSNMEDDALEHDSYQNMAASTITKTKLMTLRNTTRVHGEESLNTNGFHQNGFHKDKESKRAKKMTTNSSYALVSPGSSSSSSSHASADELALLSFKSMLSSPSEGWLASWNASNHLCSWAGVSCSRRHPDRVVSLLLNSCNLSGRISPFLGNLSFLRELDLGGNLLVGEIPQELGRLSRLVSLNLSENSIQGSIPVAIAGGCTNLTSLDLNSNELQGSIPFQIGTTMKNLAYLSLWKNNLSGEIPLSLAELPLLQRLYLTSNMLSGEIPPALGNLTSVQQLYVSKNRLWGQIPSMLHGYAIRYNMLSGTVPPNAFSALPHIHAILMNDNSFHGFFPVSLTNASNVSLIQLDGNFFSGRVPREIGRLKKLKYLLLYTNLFEAEAPKDWEFMTELTNCSQLQELALSDNKFGGVLPDSISNLSTSLNRLLLGYNKISGGIPKDISNLINLRVLDFSHNSFTGALPASLGRLTNLAIINVAQNSLIGSIPLTIGNLSQLNDLLFDMNAFSGTIPSTLGNLTNLRSLSLSNNNFTGPIPSILFSIQTLSVMFNLSHNNLEGAIPQEIGNLKNLVDFHAESNKLSGEIPSTLGECQLLQNLYLQNNFLHGSIPSSLSQLKGLQTLDLSSNNLSGQIPKFLGDITMLYSLNLSFNNFVGEVPTVGIFADASRVSIEGNDKLCGGIPNLHLPPCSLQLPKKKHKFPVAPVLISLIATLIILALLYKLVYRYKKGKAKIPPTVSMQGHPLISYSQLVKATDNFSANNLLGSGSFGSVYKGELEDHDRESVNFVVVKVLKLQTPGALKSFTAECEALRNLRHRNLVKIITACSSIDNSGNDFKAIVFDFMPNGSLEGWLHPDTNNQRHLNLLERVSILLDVANALDYLHCHGHIPVVHCDLKPSNVLLDAEMVAHVGDFGLAKILVEGNSLLQQSTSSMGFRGTIGYAPPEYGAGNMVSTHGDIYSYGILVLETVTGKRPTDSKFIQGLNLHEYVELSLHDGIIVDAVDPQLSLDLENELDTPDDSSYKGRVIGCLVSLLRLGLSCSQEMPSNRMSTGDIIKEMSAIKQPLLGFT